MSEANKISLIKSKLDRVTESWFHDEVDQTDTMPLPDAKGIIEERYGNLARAAGFEIIVDEKSSSRLDYSKTPAKWKFLDSPQSDTSIEINFELVGGDHKIQATYYGQGSSSYDHYYKGKQIGFRFVTEGTGHPLSLTSYIEALTILKA